MKPVTIMPNDELADLYCSFRSEFVNQRLLVPYPDPKYFADLDDDAHKIYSEMAKRGMLVSETDPPGKVSIGRGGGHLPDDHSNGNRAGFAE